jgi:hypothetical protein
MDAVLEKFIKEFTPERKSVAVTWHRDVDFTPVALDDPDLLKWAITVPSSTPFEQQLLGIELKWNMDVDETFYMGDDSIPCPGLLNMGPGEVGDTVLVTPFVFGRDCMNDTRAANEFPCKWVSYFGGRKIAYYREKLLFKLCWPTYQVVNGLECFVGGIAPLKMKG